VLGRKKENSVTSEEGERNLKAMLGTISHP